MVLTFFGDGYTFPGYNYLGPGNTIYKEEEPINDIDLHAYIHDLEYELATTKSEIREADRQAISAFIEDYKKTGSVAGFAGIVGLGLKYEFESVFGVVYPRMNTARPKTFGQLIYAEREKHIAQEWARIKDTPDKGGYRNFQDFKSKALIAKRIYAAYAEGGQYYIALKRDFDATRASETAGPSTRSDNGPSSKRQRIETTSESNSDITDDPTFIEKTNHNNNHNTNMDVNLQKNIQEQSGSSRGPNTGARSGATGSGDTPSNNITWIRPSTPCSSNFINLKKNKNFNKLWI